MWVNMEERYTNDHEMYVAVTSLSFHFTFWLEPSPRSFCFSWQSFVFGENF